MNYSVRRIDPFWLRNPALPAAAAVGAAAALFGVSQGKSAVTLAGIAVAGISIFLSARPAVSAVLAVVGLLGGVAQFYVVPSPSTLGMTVLQKFLATAMFTVIYAALMDGFVLLACVLYNLFSGVAGLRGLSLELEPESGGDA